MEILFLESSYISHSSVTIDVKDGGKYMSEIIDFETLRLRNFIEKECNLHQKGKIDRVVEEQVLTIKEHAALLNILKILQDMHIEPKHIFRDVFELSKKDFERVYKLEWWAIAKHCLVFLRILKDNNEEDYDSFFEQ